MIGYWKSVARRTNESDKRNDERNDERNANKRVCLPHSIQNNPSAISADPPSIMFLEFFCEKYMYLINT